MGGPGTEVEESQSGSKEDDNDNALLGKMVHRIMIHSKNYFSVLVRRKSVFFCLKIELN